MTLLAAAGEIVIGGPHSFGQTLKNIAEIVGSIGVIGGFMIALGQKMIVKPLAHLVRVQVGEVREQIDQRVGVVEDRVCTVQTTVDANRLVLERQIDAKVSEARIAVDERLRPIEYQLHPNGGNSMKDSVRRIEAKVEALGTAVAASEAKHSTYLRAQATELSREGLHPPRPEDFGIE